MSKSLKQYHGKAIALDIKDSRAHLPLLFLVHEFRVRGANFYQPNPGVTITQDWQDWILSDGVVHENEGNKLSFSFKREGRAPSASQSQNARASSSATAPSGSQFILPPPTTDLIKELLAYQRTMPSWKACQKEGMSWEGTAEENTKKYVENIGVESAE